MVVNFKSVISEHMLRIKIMTLLDNCFESHRTLWWQVNIVSGNGMGPWLSAVMSTPIYVAKLRH